MPLRCLDLALPSIDLACTMYGLSILAIISLLFSLFSIEFAFSTHGSS